MWIGLAGAPDEPLIAGISLAGSHEALGEARRKCKAGTGTSTAKTPPKPALPSQATEAAPATGRGLPGHACPHGDDHTAWSYVQRGVERRLRNPRSADFPFGGFRDLRKTGRCTWRVDSWVEGTNAFGGVVRQRYRGEVTLLRQAGRMDWLEFH